MKKEQGRRSGERWGSRARTLSRRVKCMRNSEFWGMQYRARHSRAHHTLSATRKSLLGGPGVGRLPARTQTSGRLALASLARCKAEQVM